MKMDEDVDLTWLAENTSGFVGADLAQLCTEAAMICIREKSDLIDYNETKLPDGLLDTMKISMKHFKTA